MYDLDKGGFSLCGMFQIRAELNTLIRPMGKSVDISQAIFVSITLNIFYTMSN